MKVQANYNVTIADIIMQKDEFYDIEWEANLLAFNELIDFVPAYCKKPYFNVISEVNIDTLNEDENDELNNSTIEDANEWEKNLSDEYKPEVEVKKEIKKVNSFKKVKKSK